MRRPVVAVLAVGLLLAGCGGTDPRLVLVPDDGGRATTATVQLAPTDPPACGDALSWDEPPTTLHLVDTGYARTVTVQGFRADVEQLVVCDLAPGEEAATVTDPLTNTGTSRPVGNDYVAQVGIRLGRVDVGIPEGAVSATYTVGEWTVTYPLEGLTVLRLHALEGGSDQEGWTMGSVTFLDADGVDVTPADVEIPDVIHGVPRDRDNGAEVERED